MFRWLNPGMSLKDRIQELIDAGHTRAALARFAEVSPGAVTQWLSGDTKAIKSEVAARLQLRTGFSAVWLSTGRGHKRIDSQQQHQTGFKAADVSGAYQSAYWPFSVTVEEFRQHITPQDLARLDAYIVFAVRSTLAESPAAAA